MLKQPMSIQESPITFQHREALLDQSLFTLTALLTPILDPIVLALGRNRIYRGNPPRHGQLPLGSSPAPAEWSDFIVNLRA
jgi:hypothetical protein